MLERFGYCVVRMSGRGNASDGVRRLERAGIALQPGTVARWFALTGQSDSAFAHMRRATQAHSPDVATALPFSGLSSQ
jgi:hypothetical protein